MRLRTIGHSSRMFQNEADMQSVLNTQQQRDVAAVAAETSVWNRLFVTKSA